MDAWVMTYWGFIITLPGKYISYEAFNPLKSDHYQHKFNTKYSRDL